MAIIQSAMGIFLIIYGGISFAGVVVRVTDMIDNERKEQKTRIRISAILSVAIFSIGLAIMIN